MPIWVKCILLLWVVEFVMRLFVRLYAEQFAEKIAIADVTKRYNELPWYIFVYGGTVIICRLSIIPLAIWFIFLM